MLGGAGLVRKSDWLLFDERCDGDYLKGFS